MGETEFCEKLEELETIGGTLAVKISELKIMGNELYNESGIGERQKDNSSIDRVIPEKELEEVNSLIERYERYMERLKDYRTLTYRDDCHHEIPLHFENKLIPTFINDARMKRDNGEYHDAKIILEYGLKVIERVTNLYDHARLRALLSVLRDK